MANKTNEKKQQAQFIYMAGGKTQKEIADMIGVSERSVHSWVHQYAWDKLRLAAFQAPATIADNLSAQIVELQNVIAAREPGKRYPTPQEAEVSRKLISSWEKMKRHPSLSVNMQVLETFRNYIRPVDKDFAQKLGRYTNDFIGEKAVNGYAPYQVEYGVQPVSPVLPDYDEVEGMDDNDEVQTPCPDHLTCLHVGNCHYPGCLKAKKRIVTVDDYKVSPVLFTRSNQQKTTVAAEVTGSIAAISKSEIEDKPQIFEISVNSENLPAGQAGSAESRFLEILKKLSNSDQGIAALARLGFNEDGTIETGSDPATFTSEDRKNDSAVLTQELRLKGGSPLGADGFTSSAQETQDNDLSALYAA